MTYIREDCNGGVIRNDDVPMMMLHGEDRPSHNGVGLGNESTVTLLLLDALERS